MVYKKLKLFRVARKVLEVCSDSMPAMNTGAIVSAMEIHIFFVKKSTKTVHWEKIRAFWSRLTKIFEIKKSRNCYSKISLKIVWKWKKSRSKNFDFFRTQKMHAMRTQTDRAPRDLNGIASDQNEVKIMLLYFQKNCGFPMLRSTQNDEKLLLLFSGR